MEYGLRIRDANGNIILDILDRITRLRYQTTALANQDGSIDLPDIATLQTCEFSLSLSSNVFDCAHQVSRSGVTISWTAAGFRSTDSEIFVFIYT